MTKAQLMALRASKLQAAKALLAAHPSPDAEQTATIDALVAEANSARDQIAAVEASAARVAAIDAELNAIPAPRSVAPNTPTPRVEAVVNLADADPNRGFATPRDYFSAVMRAERNPSAMDVRLRPLAAVGSDEQSGSQDSYGGFLIPRGFAPNLLEVQAEADPTAGRVTALPMSSPSVDIPARVDKDHSTSVSGGLIWTRRPETGAGVSSRQKYEQVSLKANSLMGVNYSSNELLRDSPISVAALIARGFSDEYQAHILNEKLNGTGAGEFQGIMNSPALVTIAKETGQAADTIVTANILKMRARCWGFANAIWIANHDTYPQLAQLALAVGTGGTALYQTSIVEDRPDTLLGRPIFYSEFTKTLGDSGDIVLGNWSEYLEGTLQGMDMQESIHVRFLNNENTFRATVRNDGQCWWKTALTPKNSTATLSPFVVLGTR